MCMYKSVTMGNTRQGFSVRHSRGTGLGTFGSGKVRVDDGITRVKEGKE